MQGGTELGLDPSMGAEWSGDTHPARTGRSQQLPQAPGHLLYLGQQSPQWRGAPLSPKVLGGKQGRGGQPRVSRCALRGSPPGALLSLEVTAQS